MLIFAFLLDLKPFSDLADFLEEAKDHVTVPRVTEIKWMSMIYSCDYIFHPDRAGLLIYAFGDVKVGRMRKVYEWLIPFRNEVNKLQSDSVATPTAVMKAIATFCDSVEAGIAPNIPIQSQVIMTELERRFETNFSSEAMMITLYLTPSLDISSLPSEIRATIVNTIIHKGSEILFAFKRETILKTSIRDWLRRDLARHMRGELKTQQADFLNHWQLVGSECCSCWCCFC